MQKAEKCCITSLRLILLEFQGHHTNQAYYKSGIMPPGYHCILSIVQNSGLSNLVALFLFVFTGDESWV
jgi:hypothetical protein